MQFSYAKEMAEEAAGEPVREVVITVPSWFGQSERKAMLDAIELAGLRSIGLVNDGTAGEPHQFPRCSFMHLRINRKTQLLSTTP